MDMNTIEKIKIRNIILLGLGFLFVYTAYQTTAATGDTVLKSYNIDHPNNNIDGEIGMALNYAGTTIMAVFVPGLLIFISSLVLEYIYRQRLPIRPFELGPTKPRRPNHLD